MRYLASAKACKWDISNISATSAGTCVDGSAKDMTQDNCQNLFYTFRESDKTCTECRGSVYAKVLFTAFFGLLIGHLNLWQCILNVIDNLSIKLLLF